MSSSHHPSDRNDERLAASAAAPGGVPPTGGVPPEDAPSATTALGDERSAVDDLVESLELLLRATRKAVRSVDPRLEAAAERALLALQQFDADAVEALRQEPAATEAKDLEGLAEEVGRDLAALVERVVTRVESVLAHSKK